MRGRRTTNPHRATSFYGRLRVPEPTQLELDGTATSKAVEIAHRKVKKARQESRSWEDDFDFHVRARRLPPITRKFRFAESIGRKWEADFAYPNLHLLIEIDGGVWRSGGGAHSHPSNIMRDMEKQNDATRLGYQVLRFTSDQVRNGYAIDFLIRVLHERHERHEQVRATVQPGRDERVPSNTL